MRYAFFVALFAFTALAQVSLIYIGALQSMSSYSAGNILFNLIGLLLVAWMSWTSAVEGIKKAAVRGALMALAGFAVFSLGSILGFCLKRPVFGIPAASWPQLLMLLAFVCVFNTALTAAVAAATAFIAHAVKKKAG